MAVIYFSYETLKNRVIHILSEPKKFFLGPHIRTAQYIGSYPVPPSPSPPPVPETYVTPSEFGKINLNFVT